MGSGWRRWVSLGKVRYAMAAMRGDTQASARRPRAIGRPVSSTDQSEKVTILTKEIDGEKKVLRAPSRTTLSHHCGERSV